MQEITASYDYTQVTSVIGKLLDQRIGFIHPMETGLHYPLITKDVSRSYRRSLGKGRIYLEAKKCPIVL